MTQILPEMYRRGALIHGTVRHSRRITLLKQTCTRNSVYITRCYRKQTLTACNNHLKSTRFYLRVTNTRPRVRRRKKTITLLECSSCRFKNNASQSQRWNDQGSPADRCLAFNNTPLSYFENFPLTRSLNHSHSIRDSNTNTGENRLHSIFGAMQIRISTCNQQSGQRYSNMYIRCIRIVLRLNVCRKNRRSWLTRFWWGFPKIETRALEESLHYDQTALTYLCHR